MKGINEMKTAMDIMKAMSEGNPGALSVIVQVMQESGPETFLKVMDHLDMAGIYADQIWVLYKDNCQCDVQKMVNRIQAADETLIEALNDYRIDTGKGHTKWYHEPYTDDS